MRLTGPTRPTQTTELEPVSLEQEQQALTVNKDELQVQVIRWERRGRHARGWGLGWTIWTSLTYISLSLWPADFAEGRPIFIAGAAFSMFFAVGLAWPTRDSIRGSLPRIIMLLRWQVATGLTLAFSFAIAARVELQLPILLYGVYLIISAIPLMATSLIAGKLRGLYDTARELEHTMALVKIRSLLTSLQAKPAGRTWWKP